MFTTRQHRDRAEHARPRPPGDLLRDADLAMYRAKAQGKARYEVFDPSMDAQAMERLELETDLRHAIERERAAGRTTSRSSSWRPGGSARSRRWCAGSIPTRGLISPVAVHPAGRGDRPDRPDRAAGCWRRRAGRPDAGSMEHPTLPPLTLSVNLSARQFQHPRLVDEIVRGRWPRPGSIRPRCELEITESVVMEDAEPTVETLRAARSSSASSWRSTISGPATRR